LSELNGAALASDQKSVWAMLAITSVYFGIGNFSTSSSRLLVQSCGRWNALSDLAHRASKNATPVSLAEGHTVFCTPNTDDWTGGVARPQPPDLEFLSANRPAQILTT